METCYNIQFVPYVHVFMFLFTYVYSICLYTVCAYIQYVLIYSMCLFTVCAYIQYVLIYGMCLYTVCAFLLNVAGGVGKSALTIQLIQNQLVNNTV